MSFSLYGFFLLVQSSVHEPHDEPVDWRDERVQHKYKEGVSMIFAGIRADDRIDHPEAAHEYHENQKWNNDAS